MRIVTFGLEVPYEGVPHAGGEYYLRHVEALRDRGHDVVVVVPQTPENDAAASRGPSGVRVHVVRALHLPVRDRLDWIRSRALPIHPPVGFLEAVRRDPVVRDALRAADVVELQWTQIVAALPVLRPLVPAPAAVVGVAHDVVSQGFNRRAGRSSLAQSLRRQVRAAQARRAEPRLLDRLDAVLTFSEKDRDLLHRLGVRSRVEVVRPPIASVPEQLLPEGRTEPTVLFVGAFNRPENRAGADWLLDEVWPRVRAERADARLRIVGAHPGEALRSRADADPSVVVTGYVEDLTEEYRGSAVAVVPLLLGAGVKFKTVVAMTWALPVVATTVGAEGVVGAEDGAELGVMVTDDAEGFAAAVLAVLRELEPAAARAARGRAFALQEFGTAGFAARIDGLYRELHDAHRR